MVVTSSRIQSHSKNLLLSICKFQLERTITGDEFHLEEVNKESYMDYYPPPTALGSNSASHHPFYPSYSWLLRSNFDHLPRQRPLQRQTSTTMEVLLSRATTIPSRLGRLTRSRQCFRWGFLRRCCLRTTTSHQIHLCSTF